MFSHEMLKASTAYALLLGNHVQNTGVLCVLKQKDPSLDSPNAEIFPEQLTDSMSTLMLLVPMLKKNS